MPEFPVKVDLFCRSVWLAFLLAILWESANLFFDAFIAKVYQILKKRFTMKQMLASQGILVSANSDDPNGTLIAGLKNRERPFTQVFDLILKPVS